MSEAGIIDARDVAEFVREAREGDSASANGINAANVVWSVWVELGKDETNPEIGVEEAEEVLEDMPLIYEEEKE